MEMSSRAGYIERQNNVSLLAKDGTSNLVRRGFVRSPRERKKKPHKTKHPSPDKMQGKEEHPCSLLEPW